MFAILVTVVIAAGFVWPVCRVQSCTCDTATTCYPNGTDTDCTSDSCRDYFKLETNNTFKCVHHCPDGKYDEPSTVYPYNQCLSCSVRSHCTHCRKLFDNVECTTCESGYHVDHTKCTPNVVSLGTNETSSWQDVCPLFTCVLPVVGGGVAVIVVVICLWVMCRHRGRRQPPPAREEIGILPSRDPEAPPNHQDTSGFDPPSQTRLETETPRPRPDGANQWGAETPRSRTDAANQGDTRTTGSNSTENSRKKHRKKRKRSKDSRHHSDRTDRTTDRRQQHDAERRRTEPETARPGGDAGRNKRRPASIISEATKIYQDLKNRGARSRCDLPPVPPEEGQSYENEEVINQLRRAGPSASTGSGATNGSQQNVTPMVAPALPAVGQTQATAAASGGAAAPPGGSTSDHPVRHDYENEDVIKTLHKSKVTSHDKSRYGGATSGDQQSGVVRGHATAHEESASPGVAASGSIADTNTINTAVRTGESATGDTVRPDYENEEVIKTLHKSQRHEYENKHVIEQLRQSKEQEEISTKHDYVNVDK